MQKGLPAVDFDVLVELLERAKNARSLISGAEPGTWHLRILPGVITLSCLADAALPQQMVKISSIYLSSG